MTKIKLLVAFAVTAASATAFAGGSPGSIGLGAEFDLSGAGGLSMNYDAGKFHVGPFLSYFDPAGADNTTFEIGGRFYYHVHSTATADFGIGGGIGIVSTPVTMGGMTQRDELVFIEPSFQIRLFVASNVALSFTGGISIGVVDASGVVVTGQGVSTSSVDATGAAFVGGAGVHYYFF